MSGDLVPSIPAPSRRDWMSRVSQRSRIRVTQLMKCSGVFPVGSDITPPGFFRTHSINRSAVSFPSMGKFGTSTIPIFSVGV